MKILGSGDGEGEEGGE